MGKVFGNDSLIDMYYYHGKNENDNNFVFYCCTDDCYKVYMFIGDQAKTDRLDAVIKDRRDGWDIIIYNAYHVPYHQIIIFEHLWKHVKPGGLYIVDEIETSYHPDSKVNSYYFKAGINVDGPKKSLNCFNQYIDVINRRYFGEPGSEVTKFFHFEGDISIPEISFVRVIMYARKAFYDTEGVRDNNGHTYSHYPHVPIRSTNRIQIEPTLKEAKHLFDK